MSGAPTVTVVIPVYNGAAFIESAVRSVLDQTSPPLECIVVDDGSTDDTPALLEGFGLALRVVRNENGGVASARNAGLAVASGSHIAFLDADDCWLPDKLRRQVDAVQRRPDAGLVYTGFWVVEEDLTRRHAILPSPWEGRVREALLHEGFGIGFASTALVPKAVIDAVGPFDERLSTSADLDYLWRIARRFPGVGIREPLALYRQHGGSQGHNDLRALESDMGHILAAFEADGDRRSVERAHGNLHAHLFAQYLLRRDLAMARHHARLGWGWAPSRLVRRPAGSVGRHAKLTVLNRWPAFPARDLSIID